MIPHEIAELATALEAEFGIGRDQAVAAAWKISKALEAADPPVKLTCQ